MADEITHQQLEGNLPDAMRAEEAAQRALAGLLHGPAKVATLFEWKREGLANLLNPQAVPDHLVAYLAELVGVGPRTLSASRRLDTAQLRALIPGAVDLWKRKGTRTSWRTVVSAFTGSRALIFDWFYYRTITGSPAMVHTIPGPGTFPPGSYAYPEFVSDVWWMDPDGGADVDAMGRWLEEVRANGERINLYLAWLVEDGATAASLWTLQGVGTHGYDADARELSARNGAHYLAEVAGAPGWADYNALLRLAVTGIGHVLIYQGATAADAYKVILDIPARQVRLARRVGGIDTGLVTYAFGAWSPLAGAFYRWTFEAITGSTSTRVNVYVEGLLVIGFDDAAGARHTQGALRWGAPTGVGNAVVLGATGKISPINPPHNRVGPAT